MSESSSLPFWICHKAGKTGYLGKDVNDQARVIQIRGAITDLKTEFFKACFNPEYKESLQKGTGADSKFNKIVANLAVMLGENEWFLGYPTVADIEFVYMAYIFGVVLSSAEVENPVDSHANLKAVAARVWELDGIKEWVESDAWKRPILLPSMLPWINLDIN